MPEIEIPGHFVEEVPVSRRAIAGVSTGTAAFVGSAADGAIGKAKRVHSLAGFESAFGGPPRRLAPGTDIPHQDYLWHAARAFFEGGGKRLSIVRAPSDVGEAPTTEALAKALTALEAGPDIEIVAAPGSTTENDERAHDVAIALIDHAQRMKYRFALIDSPKGADTTTIRTFRSQFDTRHAALYYPWIKTSDGLLLPPCGSVAAVFAATDEAIGVWKTPAGGVVKGAVGFERAISQPEQELLNPESINCFRGFDGRGHRLWGARTLSSELEWKYVPVRRLISFVECSIEAGLGWAVFEPNGVPLWATVTRAIETFLFDLWREGGLAGTTPHEAFFVKCNRTTMTRDDIDNGRLIAEIGIAPLRPAEFMIIRIGVATAVPTI